MANFTKNELLSMIRSRAESIARTPLTKYFPYSSSVRYKFDSWNSAIQLSGLDPNTRKGIPKYSRSELIQMIQEKAKEIGRTPRYVDFKKASTAIHRFGSWNNALKEAGLEPNARTKGHKFNRDELIELIRKKSQKLGHSPSFREFHYSSQASQLFGSWNKALRASGLKVRKTNPINKFTDHELLSMIRDLFIKLGHTPRTNDFKHFSMAAYRFDSWNNAVKMAGLTPNNKR